MTVNYLAGVVVGLVWRGGGWQWLGGSGTKMWRMSVRFERYQFDSDSGSIE
jgi:hypothetical protein